MTTTKIIILNMDHSSGNSPHEYYVNVPAISTDHLHALQQKIIEADERLREAVGNRALAVLSFQLASDAKFRQDRIKAEIESSGNIRKRRDPNLARSTKEVKRED
jgi:hypothetical protein